LHIGGLKGIEGNGAQRRDWPDRLKESEMKRILIATFSAVMVVALGGVAMATPQVSPQWYDVTFTGADIWTYSADNVTQARTDQDAPRRYRDWTNTLPVQATTYGLNGGLSATGFGAWAPDSGFAFDEISLWGKGGATVWGEQYVAVPDDANNGTTSWKVIAAPAGWTNGIVLGNQDYNAGSGAFPVWRSGTGSALSLANMNDPSFVFEFQVLISNPDTAFDANGKLRVFFGGYSDDLQNNGPDNYEVSGVMELDASPVPEPASLLVWSVIGGVGFVGARMRRRKTVAA
jgi:hypothetical protein